MRPTTDSLQALLRHFSGEEESREPLNRVSWSPDYFCGFDGFSEEGPIVGSKTLLESRLSLMRLDRFADRETGFSRTLKEMFGRKTFYAGICFIDMVGFSALTCGKTPGEVAG